MFPSYQETCGRVRKKSIRLAGQQRGVEQEWARTVPADADVCEGWMVRRGHKLEGTDEDKGHKLIQEPRREQDIFDVCSDIWSDSLRRATFIALTAFYFSSIMAYNLSIPPSILVVVLFLLDFLLIEFLVINHLVVAEYILTILLHFSGNILYKQLKKSLL